MRTAPERLDVEDGEDVAGYGQDFVERLGKPLQGREIMDPLDAGGARHGGVIDELRKRHR